MRRIGVPISDLNELFGRMLFNALCGNDDDHPRNYAVIWMEAERKWRLSPAFDEYSSEKSHLELFQRSHSLLSMLTIIRMSNLGTKRSFNK